MLLSFIKTCLQPAYTLWGKSFAKRFRSPAWVSDPPERQTNPLETYFDAYTEGPGIWKWRHYFDIYHRHFSKFIGRDVHVLEIGIYSGGSLGMWRNYFGAQSHIYGMDIEEACRTYEAENIRIFVGDQADRSFWRRFRDEVPKVDVLIDDGGHSATQQRVTLEEMLPHISPGGVYLCEDILGGDNRFAAFVSGIQQSLHHYSADATAAGAQREIKAMHFYPWVTVIEKHETKIDHFEDGRRGTQWQPFLG